MAHIGRGVAVDAGAPMAAAYGAGSNSYQHASSAEGSESLGGRSSAIVRESLVYTITVGGKGLIQPYFIMDLMKIQPCSRSVFFCYNRKAFMLHYGCR